MLRDTGERAIPDHPDLNVQRVFLQHLARYKFALPYIKNKKVLDAGCGEGYGPDLLAQEAKEVIGIDNSQDAIKHAQNKYRRANLEFKIMDCAKMDFPNSFFDVICAFEVIEHLKNPEKVLNEVKRLLSPEGVFIISTPNKKVISQYFLLKRPFHVKEFSLIEFKNLLNQYFKKLILYGQFDLNYRKIIKRLSFLDVLRKMGFFSFLDVLRKTGFFKLRFLLPKKKQRKLIANFANFVNPKSPLLEISKDSGFRISQENIDKADYFIAICFR